MAETSSKRQREESAEETQIESHDSSKRYKSYNHILSLLHEEDEEEPNQDLSSIITTLQQELSPDSFNVNPDISTCRDLENIQQNDPTTSELEDQSDEKEWVMRHLLKASDDELGIPSSDHDDPVNDGGLVGFNGGDEFSLCDALWELEDEAANYYTLLQSELFMKLESEDILGV